MQEHYYVNINPQPWPENGEHEVHKDGCPTPPFGSNRHDLGWFSNCQDAVTAARKVYSKVDGCKNCIPQCHTR